MRPFFCQLPSPFRLSVALLLALLVVMAGASAQAQDDTFEDSTSVTLVEVPVEVSRGDEPVRGLTVENFEVYEGKKKRKIVAFDVVDLTEVTGQKMAAVGVPAAAAPALPVAARRHFLFLFDLSFSEPASLARAQAAALDVIETGLHSSDLAGVAVYSASTGARLILGFTSDREQLDLAVRTLGSPELVDRSPDSMGLVLGSMRQSQRQYATGGVTGTAKGMERDNNGARRDTVEAIQQAAVELFETLARTEGLAQDTQQRNRVNAFSRSFTEMAELLGRIESRKLLLLFSEGFESRLAVAENTGLTTQRAVESGEVWEVESDTMFGSTRVQNELERMLEEMRRSGTVVHAVDIGGVRGSVNAGADGPVSGDLQNRAAPGMGSAGEDSLFAIADGTGGSLYRNFNDLGQAVGRVLERSSVTYLLAFEPRDNPKDGSYHPITVKVTGVPGRVQVVHRDGFYSRPPSMLQTEVERKLEMASLLMGPGGGGPIRSSLAATSLPGSGSASWIPYVLQAGGEDVLEGHGQSLLTLDLSLYAFDAAGTVAAFDNQLVSFNLLKVRDALKKTGLRFYGDLELAPGSYELRALVRNQQTGSYGVAAGSLTVPEGGGPGSPSALFVERPGTWVMLRESPEKLLAPYPFVVAGQMVVPAPEPGLAEGENGEVWVRWPEGAPDPVAARITTRDGREVGEQALSVLERQADPAGPGELLLATLAASNLPPGSYLLHLSAAGGGTGPAPVPFRVTGKR